MKRGSDSSRASDISITLYYRESGHHSIDAFPVLINNRPIEECIYSTNEDLIDLALYLQQDEQLFYRIQEWFETWEEPLTNEASAAVVRSEGEKLRNKLQVHLNNKQLGFAVEFQKRPVHKLKLMNEFTVIWPSVGAVTSSVITDWNGSVRSTCDADAPVSVPTAKVGRRLNPAVHANIVLRSPKVAMSM